MPDEKKFDRRKLGNGAKAMLAKYGTEHMAALGRKGGKTRSQDSDEMARIGRKGGRMNILLHGGEDRAAKKRRQREEEDLARYDTNDLSELVGGPDEE